MRNKIEINKRKKIRAYISVRNEILGIVLLLPAVLSLLIFKYLPVAVGVFESFFKIDIVNLPGDFVGLANYIRAFTDKQFMGSIFHNLKAFVYSLAMNFWIPIVLAMLIDEIRKGKTLFRLGYFIPACTPAIAMTVLWKYFWQPDYGLANYFIGLLGIEPQLWLSSEKLVYFCMYFPGMVVCGGMNMVIYLAALQDVPREHYEAAIVDGAGILQRVRYITLPAMKNIIVLMLTLSIIGSFNLMENVLVLTGGGPANSTQTMYLYAYQVGVNSMDYSYAMAMTTIVFVITMILTIVFNRITNKED
ncbi:MAG: sugar ABC transporter permease [Clostridia bacterium]|nr:sugar ABC transporter permease [Clostridia bacterium]